MLAVSSILKSWIRSFGEVFRRQTTLPAEKVPLIFHEPSVLTGYRLCNQSWSYYTKSLFQIHNETVNVWTHIVGSIVLIYQVFFYLQLYDNDLSVTVLTSGFCFFLTVSVSAVAHLYHSMSPFHLYVLFMVDYAAATLCLYGTGLIAMYGLSDASFYQAVGNIYLVLQTVSIYIIFVTSCKSKMWYGENPHDMRRKHVMIAAYVFHALINCTPVLPKYIQCYRNPECSLSSLNHYTIIFVLTCLQAVTFVAHQPERTWPGKFDIVGHSHQWFHVITCISHVMQFKAIHYDSQHGLNVHCQPDGRYVVLSLGLVILADVGTLLLLMRKWSSFLIQKTN